MSASWVVLPRARWSEGGGEVVETLVQITQTEGEMILGLLGMIADLILVALSDCILCRGIYAV